VEAAFQTLKKAFCITIFLAHPQLRAMFVVDTDASNVGIGVVLSQVQDVQERVTACYGTRQREITASLCGNYLQL
jgi:hypothetical protein